MSALGSHVILLVIKIGLFTAEERDAVEKAENVFEGDAWKNTIIFFTHGDRVGSDFDQMLEKTGPELQEILKKVENRYHIFNYQKANDHGQVLGLLKKVQARVAPSGGKFYSKYNYQEMVRMLEQRETELREFYEKKLEEEMKAVESKYE